MRVFDTATLPTAERADAVSDAMLGSDLWWMLGLSLVLFPMMRTGTVVGRREGGLLVGAYGTYLALLVLMQ